MLDEQGGFLMRVAMQRHTSIFTSRMIEGLTQTPVRRACEALRSWPLFAESSWALIHLDAATIKGTLLTACTCVVSSRALNDLKRSAPVAQSRLYRPGTAGDRKPPCLSPPR